MRFERKKKDWWTLNNPFKSFPLHKFVSSIRSSLRSVSLRPWHSVQKAHVTHMTRCTNQLPIIFVLILFQFSFHWVPLFSVFSLPWFSLFQFSSHWLPLFLPTAETRSVSAWFGSVLSYFGYFGIYHSQLPSSTLSFSFWHICWRTLLFFTTALHLAGMQEVGW